MPNMRLGSIASMRNIEGHIEHRDHYLEQMDEDGDRYVVIHDEMGICVATADSLDEAKTMIDLALAD
jgi:phosphopantetheine adenylyltransferase